MTYNEMKSLYQAHLCKAEKIRTEENAVRTKLHDVRKQLRSGLIEDVAVIRDLASQEEKLSGQAEALQIAGHEAGKVPFMNPAEANAAYDENLEAQKELVMLAETKMIAARDSFVEELNNYRSTRDAAISELCHTASLILKSGIKFGDMGNSYSKYFCASNGFGLPECDTPEGVMRILDDLTRLKYKFV